MKYWISVFSLLFLSSLSSCGRVTQQVASTRGAFAARVESVLPSNWTVEESGQDVILRRKEPITKYTCVAMDVSVLRNSDTFKKYVDADGVTDVYAIRLRRGAAMDISEFRRLKAINNQIVATKNTPVPTGEFLEDDALRSFDSRYHELPEYYDDSTSIYVETSLGSYECIYPNAVAKECEGIRQRLDSLFHRYASDIDRRTLSRGLD
jgi:hypothetical protein